MKKKELPGEKQRRRATTRQHSDEHADRGETYEGATERVDSIDGTGARSSGGSSFDGSDSGYVGAMLVG